MIQRFLKLCANPSYRSLIAPLKGQDLKCHRAAVISLDHLKRATEDNNNHIKFKGPLQIGTKAKEYPIRKNLGIVAKYGIVTVILKKAIRYKNHAQAKKTKLLHQTNF